LYGLIESAISEDIETLDRAFTFTHMGNFQSGCLKYVSHCESMYSESNLKILFTFLCPNCCTFNKCVYVKSDWAIWNYLCQFCEGEFWIWIGGVVCVYDGKSLSCLGSICGICIYVQC
jgi:hypothetical protein